MCAYILLFFFLSFFSRLLIKFVVVAANISVTMSATAKTNSLGIDDGKNVRLSPSLSTPMLCEMSYYHYVCVSACTYYIYIYKNVNEAFCHVSCVSCNISQITFKRSTEFCVQSIQQRYTHFILVRITYFFSRCYLLLYRVSFLLLFPIK